MNVTNDLLDVNGIVKKPWPESATTTLAVASRYIPTPSIFKEPEPTPRGVGVDDARTVLGVARLAIDSTKDRIDSLRDSYEKLFAVIATLGALLAFLGFKGFESFVQARTKAQ